MGKGWIHQCFWCPLSFVLGIIYCLPWAFAALRKSNISVKVKPFLSCSKCERVSLFVDIKPNRLPPQYFSTSALGLRTSWPRLHCANPSRGGTTRLPFFLFCLSKSSSFTLTGPSSPLVFQPIAAPCHSAGCRHLSWLQSQVRQSSCAEHGTEPQRVKVKGMDGWWGGLSVIWGADFLSPFFLRSSEHAWEETAVYPGVLPNPCCLLLCFLE